MAWRDGSKDICMLGYWSRYQFSPIITKNHQFVHQFHQWYGLTLIGSTRRFWIYIYVGVLKEIQIITNFHQLSPICSSISPISWYHIDWLERKFQKYIYVVELKQIPIFTNFHQLSPICSPISPILWCNIDWLDKRIPKIYMLGY